MNMDGLYIFDCEVFAHDWVFVFKEVRSWPGASPSAEHEWKRSYSVSRRFTGREISWATTLPCPWTRCPQSSRSQSFDLRSRISTGSIIRTIPWGSKNI